MEEIDKHIQEKKSNKSLLWIWCLINSIGLLLLTHTLFISNSINADAIEKVTKLEQRIEMLEELQAKSDTIIVKIENLNIINEQ